MKKLFIIVLLFFVGIGQGYGQFRIGEGATWSEMDKYKLFADIQDALVRDKQKDRPASVYIAGFAAQEFFKRFKTPADLRAAEKNGVRMKGIIDNILIQAEKEHEAVLNGDMTVKNDGALPSKWNGYFTDKQGETEYTLTVKNASSGGFDFAFEVGDGECIGIIESGRALKTSAYKYRFTKGQCTIEFELRNGGTHIIASENFKCDEFRGSDCNFSTVLHK